MKKVIFLVLILLSYKGFGQLDQEMPQSGYTTKKFTAREIFRPPSDTTVNKTGISRIGTTMYVGNGTYWTAAGSSGGSTNTSIGSAFRIAVNGTNNIKSISFGWGITGDSATTGQVGIKADSTSIKALTGIVTTDSSFYRSGTNKVNARWWYNVKDYGAIPNDGLTDDVAIQNAINACHAAGGGTVYFPIGVYTLTNAPVRTIVRSPGDTALNNNQIYIPLVKYTADSAGYRTVRLLGESPSHTESQVVATYPNPMNGAVLNSTYITSVDDVGGFTKNVLGALSYGSNSFNFWNYTNISVRDLAVIVATRNSSGVEVQNKMCGISFQYVATARLEGNVKIRTSSAPENQLDPFPQTIGYFGPDVNNHANSSNDKVYSAGFWTGLKISEHSSFQEIMLHANRYGLEINPYYKVIIASLIAENNAYIIKMNNGSNLAITGWSGEKNATPGKYYTPIVDIYEGSAGARGTITVQHLTINNSGTPTIPTKIGDSIKVLINSDQYGQNYIPLNPKATTTINYNQTYYDSVTNLNYRWAGSTLGWRSYGTGTGSGITVGTTTITSGTSGRVGYNNAGVYGEYAITGTGNVAMSASPTFTGTVNTAAIIAAGSISTNGGNMNIGQAFPTASQLRFYHTDLANSSDWLLTNKQNGTGFALYNNDNSQYKWLFMPDGSFWLGGTNAYPTLGGAIRGTSAGLIGIGIDAVDKLDVDGNLSLRTAGNKLKITTGANASIGVSAAMTAGTITISTTAVTASSRIFLNHATVAGTIGILSVGTITAGTSFVINSSSGTDTGTVNWWIIN